MPKKDEFTESYEKLIELSEKIKDEDTSLEESIKCFEEGMKYYKKCDAVLKDAEQKIEVIEEEAGE